jgi:hypothetical protein
MAMGNCKIFCIHYTNANILLVLRTTALNGYYFFSKNTFYFDKIVILDNFAATTPQFSRNLPRRSCNFYDFCHTIAAIVRIFATTMPQFFAFWLVAVPQFLALLPRQILAPALEAHSLITHIHFHI